MRRRRVIGGTVTTAAAIYGMIDSDVIYSDLLRRIRQHARIAPSRLGDTDTHVHTHSCSTPTVRSPRIRIRSYDSWFRQQTYVYVVLGSFLLEGENHGSIRSFFEPYTVIQAPIQLHSQDTTACPRSLARTNARTNAIDRKFNSPQQAWITQNAVYTTGRS